jgi:hypothetical protein
VRTTVQLYENSILEHLGTEEVRPDVVIPEIVFTYGRPAVVGAKETTKSTLMPEKMAVGFLKGGSLFHELAKDAETYLFVKNLHHQLKAQLLDKEVVIQIVRETTLDSTIELDNFGNPKRSLQATGAGSDGINPLTDPVSLTIGTYSVTIPSGSFHQLPNGSKRGSYVYAGVIGGVTLQLQILQLAGNQFQLKSTGGPVNLTGLPNPVTVTIVIGNDLGTTSVKASH